MPNDQQNTSATSVSDADVAQRLKEKFDALPKVVQDAITSADVQKRLRSASDNHKLHLDQWGILENEVMLTLLGFQDPNDLAAHIQSEVGIPAEESAALAADVNKLVFEPIRQELERGLSHPEAKAETISAEEATRQQVLADETAQEAVPATVAPTPETPVGQTQAPQAVLPATPPAPAPTEKAIRAPISSSYSSRQASTERKSVEGDPYREPPA